MIINSKYDRKVDKMYILQHYIHQLVNYNSIYSTYCTTCSVLHFTIQYFILLLIYLLSSQNFTAYVNYVPFLN